MTSQPASHFKTFLQRFTHPIWPALVAALAGAVNVLAFAPFHLWPVQIFSMAILFHLGWNAATVKRAAWIGWAYGASCLFFGFSWLIIALNRYGELPLAFAILAIAVLGAALGIFAALVVGGSAHLKRRWQLSEPVGLLLVLPAMWAISELLRGWLFTGFPWLSNGYAHAASPLAAYAPLLGVYGVGWIAAILAACFALWRHVKLGIPVALAILLGGAGLQQVHWTQAQGNTITVNLLQGNIAQDIKFDEAHVVDSLVLYRNMVMATPADLIATPETAVPLPTSLLPQEYLAGIADFARRSNSHIMMGVFSSDPGNRYSNSLFAYSPVVKEVIGQPYRYDKHHLVPFGEFVPYGFHWLIDMMKIPLGDLSSAGVLQPPFKVKDQYVMPDICYENLFGEEIAAQLSDQYTSGKPVASILINASNLAWYGDSIAMPQHLQISQMRALETGRPMLMSTNTGATSVIDPHGKVVRMLDYWTKGNLYATVQGMTGITPYIRAGNMAIILLVALALLVTWRTRRKL